MIQGYSSLADLYALKPHDFLIVSFAFAMLFKPSHGTAIFMTAINLLEGFFFAIVCFGLFFNAQLRRRL